MIKYIHKNWILNNILTHMTICGINLCQILCYFYFYTESVKAWVSELVSDWLNEQKDDWVTEWMDQRMTG